VDGVDANLLQFLGNLLGGKHGGVRAGLFLVGGHLHASGDSAVGFAAGEVGHVDEGIIPGGEDVSHSENESFALNWGTEMIFLLLLLLDNLLDLKVT
jgi:hypothetical protein